MPHIKRLVLNFPGFETTSSVHQIERLTAGGLKTAKMWGFELNTDEIVESSVAQKTVTDFGSKGKNWTADTRYVHFSWSDIIEKYEEKSYPASLFRHFPKYLSFFLDGSVIKYAKSSMRYWGFTVYPLLLMFVFALIASAMAQLALASFGTHWIFTAIAAFILFLVFCKFPGDRFYVNLSVNDWAFARDMCNGSNPEITSRFDHFAEILAEEVKNIDPDEILLVGHSFGSVWATNALAIALEKEPQLLEGRRVTFLALGSSLLKIGLVPEADFLRSAAKRVTSTQNMLWHEIQTKTDFISFYKSDPFAPMQIISPECDVIVHRVNFKKALSKTRHKKMLKSMYLAHRQYILYCDQKVHHDFQLRVFGPFFADDLARDVNLATTSKLVQKEGANK